MKLLSNAPSLENYCNDLSKLIKSETTHFYIDTSFLFWLSKLGTAARSEFFTWTNEVGDHRFHVPLWASHEYHQHLVDATISKQISDPISKLNQAAKNFYDQLLPVIAEAEDAPRWTSNQVKTGARQAVLDLMRFGGIIESWGSRTWDERSSEVIKFINKCCLKSGRTFDYLNTIGQTTNNRYSGRVPPGFEDRMKKDTQDQGGNRSGDLMFWKEILDHTRHANRFPLRKIGAIIVLSNDKKNDWVLGGDPVTQDGSIGAFKGIRKEWSRIPIIHPMLEHEAQVYSKVRRVALMNEFSLGAYFLATNQAGTFVEASVTTEMPKHDRKALVLEKAEKPSKGGGGQHRGAATNLSPEASSAVELDRSKDGLEISGADANSLDVVTPPGHTEPLAAPLQILSDATTAQENIDSEVKQVVDEMLSIGGVIRPMTEWLTDDFLAPSNLKRLIRIARRLTESAILKIVGAEQRVIDLLASLDEIDTAPAVHIYAGILFSLYFDSKNQVLTNAKPQILQRVFDYQNKSFAAPGIKALRLAFKDPMTDRPPYLPDTITLPIEAEAQAKSHENKLLLSALLINGVDYLVSVAPGDPSSLYRLLGFSAGKDERKTATAHDLILMGARILGFPFSQIKIKRDPERSIFIAPSDGLNILMNGENCDENN